MLFARFFRLPTSVPALYSCRYADCHHKERSVVLSRDARPPLAERFVAMARSTACEPAPPPCHGAMYVPSFRRHVIPSPMCLLPSPCVEVTGIIHEKVERWKRTRVPPPPWQNILSFVFCPERREREKEGERQAERHCLESYRMPQRGRGLASAEGSSCCLRASAASRHQAPGIQRRRRPTGK